MAVICRLPQGVGGNGKMYLYNEGDECKSLTNGWGTFIVRNENSTLTKNSDHLFMKIEKSVVVDSGNNVYFTPNKSIDLTDYSKLFIAYTSTTYENGSAFRARLFSEIPYNDTENLGAYTISMLNAPAVENITILEIDVSAITQEAFITTNAWNFYSANGYELGEELTAKIYKIWLEK